MRLSTTVSAAACAALLATGCSDPTTVPLRPRPSMANSVVSAGRAIYPNSQKYRDAGYHGTVGRSASAAITARALLNKNGTTDVEVTTGNFDGGAPLGSIASVQVKGLDATGGLLFASNQTGLTSSTVSFPYTGLNRSSSVQLQAIVRGVDDARSEVVTVTDRVRWRPDLVALKLAGPEEAALGVPVNLEAFVGEFRRDLGARATLVLYVDGVEADRAEDIWVDAGGVANCVMAHRFMQAGTHTLELRVEGVKPGDYDDTNNRATMSIKVKPPNEFAAFSLQAWSVVEASSNRYRWDSFVGDTSHDVTVTQQGSYQFASMGGLIPRSLQYPITMRGEMLTNGARINILDRTHDAGVFVDWQPGFCAVDYALFGGASTYICVYTGGYLAGYSSVQYDWWGGDVRYHSEDYVSFWDTEGNLKHSWVLGDWSQTGPMAASFGPDFTGRLWVQGKDDPVPAAAIGSITLSPFTSDWDYVDPSCALVPVPLSCYELHFHLAGTNGYMDYGAWPPYVP